MKKKYLLFSILFLGSLLVNSLSAITSPEKFLGFRIGEDRKLADYTKIEQYLKKLDEESARVQLIDLGPSTEKRSILMAVISNENNLKEIDRYIKIARDLRDPRKTSVEEARRLSKEGKVIVMITCNLHSTEIASSQMALEFAYNLANCDDQPEIKKILDDVILLLVPSINPDGTQMVCDWYKKNIGTPFEGGRMPWLYHKYAGHDNNRDWYMFNLAETRAVSKALYHDWLPQIHLDEHQMGSTGARLFVPPFMDPTIPQLLPLLWRSVGLIGANMAMNLEEQGKSGVVHGRSFTGWWIGACDDTSWLHNVVGLLSEAASVNVASPIYIDPIEVSRSYTQKRINFPNPWKGGWWRLRDIVDYELILSMSLLKTAAKYREEFLFNFYSMYRDCVQTITPGDAYAYIIPQDQADLPTALRMLEIMKMGGVEIHRASNKFTADRRVFSAGTYVVLANQPYKPYAMALFERQKYPDLRENEDMPPVPPYDNAGWTLPLQMGVETFRTEEPFKAELELLERIPALSVTPLSTQATHYILDPRLNRSFSLIFQLFKENIEVLRIAEEITIGDKKLPAGAFAVPVNERAAKVLNSFQQKYGIQALESKEPLPKSRYNLTPPRIALYQSYASSMDEGWTRFVLDDFDIPHTLVHNSDFKTKKPLNSRFDVILIPGNSQEMIRDGKPDPKSPWASFFTPLPSEYEGGIGKEGVDALKTFVADGGILVAMNDACSFAIQEFKAPVSDSLEKLGRNSFFCPTSILRINVNPSTPLGFGLPEKASAMFSDSLAFSTRVPSGDWNRSVVASYPEEDILLSGWLTGESYLSRKAAIVDLQYKKGHICLLGIPVQNRAQTHGTFKFLFNALVLPRS